MFPLEELLRKKISPGNRSKGKVILLERSCLATKMSSSGYSHTGAGGCQGRAHQVGTKPGRGRQKNVVPSYLRREWEGVRRTWVGQQPVFGDQAAVGQGSRDSLEGPSMTLRVSILLFIISQASHFGVESHLLEGSRIRCSTGPATCPVLQGPGKQ